MLLLMDTTLLNSEQNKSRYLGKGGDIFLKKEIYQCNLCKEKWESKTFT